MRIEKTDCNYQVTEYDLKFGEQITLDGELLIPISVIDKIRAEIEAKCCITVGRENDGAITLHDVFEILDKYKAETENA